MIGIEEIASYIPSKRISNYFKKEKYEIDDYFIEEKIGVKQIAMRDENEDTSDLCVEAFENLSKKVEINKDDIDVLVVVTQNPDKNIPHTSAIIHGKLNLLETCACFDISLGCSGFVYGLSIIQSFMEGNDFKKGLLFTADPYSKIIDLNDKNTSLLFGDAATITLMSDNPLYITSKFTYGTIGKDYEGLICKDNKLYMNGRSIFNFASKYLPVDIKDLLKKNKLDFEDIDKYIFHQGSKYIVNTISKRLKLDNKKVVFDISDYGNTVSSSIPIILEKEMENNKNFHIVISAFGAGLSWASTILKRIGE